MSRHTLPSLLYGVTKKINDKMPQSHVKKMIDQNISLKKQFAVRLNIFHLFSRRRFNSKILKTELVQYKNNNRTFYAKKLRTLLQNLLGNDGVLIYPTFPSAAHFPYEIFSKICDVSYMMIFNSLGLPVTQCPIGLNRNGLPIGVQVIYRYVFSFTEKLNSVNCSFYIRQVVANPGCDHLTIAVAQEIERAFGGWQPPTPGEKMV